MPRLAIGILALSSCVLAPAAFAAPSTGPNGIPNGPPPVVKNDKPTGMPGAPKKSLIPLLEYRFNGNLDPEPPQTAKLEGFGETYGPGKDGKPNTALKTFTRQHAKGFFRRSTFTIVTNVFVTPKTGERCPRPAVVFRTMEDNLGFIMNQGSFGPVGIYTSMTCRTSIYIQGAGGQAFLSPPDPIPQGKWVELMLSYDGPKKTALYYQDRKLLASSTTAPASLPQPEPATNDLVQIAPPFEGALMDDFKFYADALTPEDFGGTAQAAQMSPSH